MRFEEPQLIDQKGQLYVFADSKIKKPNKLKAKILVKKIVNDNLFFDLDFKNETKVFFGKYPMISQKGTFLINGNEKVVVFQLTRAPGVYFDQGADNKNTQLFSAQIIPKQGV